MVSLEREADPNRVMLHLDSAAPDKMLAVLDQAERLLNEAEKQGRAMQLEVIANSHGLDLLRAGVSPYAERMAHLKRRHANLQWVACGQSVARFTKRGSTGGVVARHPNRAYCHRRNRYPAPARLDLCSGLSTEQGLPSCC